MEFFRMTSEKLDPHGAILINLIGKGENDRLIRAIHTTLGEVYDYTQSFALQAKGGRADIQNILIVGRSKPIAFQLRNMAGFTEIELSEGHIILDSTSI
jgi:spermidine synthase